MTTKILFSNIFDCPLRILWHQKLGHIIDICYENCFLADVQATFNSTAFSPRAQPFFDLHARIALALTDTNTFIKIKLDNGIRVYKNKAAVREISELVAQYPFIYEFEGLVWIFLKYWMKIHLKPG